MHETKGHYEYVAVYVDDLAIAMQDPTEFINVLQGKYKFKLNGTCLETTSLLWIVLCKFTPSYTRDTLSCHTTEFVKLLLLVWLVSISFLESITLLTSLVNTGDIHKYGLGYMLFCFGMKILARLMPSLSSSKRGVLRFTQDPSSGIFTPR
jgi:hypothetical protein